MFILCLYIVNQKGVNFMPFLRASQCALEKQTACTTLVYQTKGPVCVCLLLIQHDALWNYEATKAVKA